MYSAKESYPIVARLLDRKQKENQSSNCPSQTFNKDEIHYDSGLDNFNLTNWKSRSRIEPSFWEAISERYKSLKVSPHRVLSEKWATQELGSRFAEIMLQSLQPDITFSKVVVTPQTPQDPHQAFVPSENFLKLHRQYQLSPDEETMKLIEEFQSVQTDDEVESLASIISDEVDNFITSLAKRSFLPPVEEPQNVQISENNRFISSVCRELITRIGIDPYSPRVILDALYSELRNYANTPRIRKWGEIYVDKDKSEIFLYIKPNAFPYISKFKRD